MKNHNDPDTYYNLGYAMHLKGLSNEAVKYYRKALELNPIHEQARLQLGNLAGTN